MDKIHISWMPLFDKYSIDLDFIYDTNDIVYPNKDDVFNAFSIDVKSIKLLFLGQDCYHDGSADGYAFSCKFKIPPSVRNIFTEIKNEFPEREYEFIHGNLEKWSKRENIFLLNCALTVLKSEPLSHMEIWTEFTDDVIRYVNQENKSCVFLLLGNYAKSKKELITNKEKIIECVHPSPFSARNGFFGSGIFKKIEKIIGKIDWSN